MGLAYLATPYTRYKGGIEQAFRDAAKLAAQLMRAGIKVYSPIAHTHPLAIHGNIDPLDHSIWLPFDHAMMRAADVLIVAHMDGWQKSKGIAHEVAFFEECRKPIFDLDPRSLVMTRRKTQNGHQVTDGRETGSLPSHDPDQPNNGQGALAHGKDYSMHAGTSE